MSVIPKEMLRIAHISDLHFSKISFSPLQFFSKRWIGNANLVLQRGRMFRPDFLMDSFGDFLVASGVDVVIFSGDISATSRELEFGYGLDFIREIEERNIPVLMVPGNHDRYTKSTCKNKLFYDFFANDEFEVQGPFSLKEHRIEQRRLTDQIEWIGLDTALSTRWFADYGVFDKALEEKLESLLEKIPYDKTVILTNHYPLVEKPGSNKPPLFGSKSLQNLVKRYPQIKLYLHGHRHKYHIYDHRDQGLPLAIDAGSVSHRTKGTFTFLDVSPEHCTVRAMQSKRIAQSITWEVKERVDLFFDAQLAGR